ncbi:hypothetical protein N658DRAFT_494616 [Parathielavia hyrcaniae]|uniref:Extracellular membrane protein CFEM domain-containing protein n=1 Tax=Parathielavia hyrcaniae TaxID=113614 RepID=A0AAN6T427_9PEZI|nr:hypothetical protein N658DRAFT_494616 [Parathielavia hyrcaniae]
MGRVLFSMAILALPIASASAEEILQYVTDMPIYSALAPCAQSAISYAVMSNTYSVCPEGAAELQSCVCTKNKNLASVSSRIATSVSYSCGDAASHDQSSVQTVLSAYCDPTATITLPTPTAVQVFITEIAEFSYMAECAQSGLKYAVASMTNTFCPTDAPALADCACNKNKNSAMVSSVINSRVKSSCSGILPDITSAQAMFAAYCGLNAGTSAFPVPSPPPGDMSYYITDLPQYSSLAKCAQVGLSYVVQWQTSLCPSGPQALASCACLKDGIPSMLSKSITSSVKYDCDSTAVDDVLSAIDVYNFYCSAAAGSATATGVINSVEQTFPSAVSSGIPSQTSASGTGSVNNGNGTTAGSSDGSGTSSSGPSTGLIIGAAVGVVSGLALIGAIIFFVFRHVRKTKANSAHNPETGGTGPENPAGSPTPFGGGKSELASDSVVAVSELPPSSPAPSTLAVAAVPPRADTVSPASANTGAYSPPPNHQAELNGQSSLYPPMPNRPELYSQASGTPSPPPPPPELYGQGAPTPNRPELQGQGAMYAMPPPANMSELQGQGTQFYNAAPNRPELHSPEPSPNPHQMQQQQQQQQQGYYQPSHAGTPPPPPSSGGQGMYGQLQLQQQQAWHAGPVPMFHEMDAGGDGRLQR